MTDLDAAIKRFNQALSRLDGAAQKPVAGDGAETARLIGEAESLRNDLAAARSECERGQKLRLLAADALDEAIITLNETLQEAG